MIDTTTIPASRVQLTDLSTGLMSKEWYRYFYNTYLLTNGDGNATSLHDLQLIPNALNYDLEILKLKDLILAQPSQPQLGTIAPQNAENVAITGGYAALDYVEIKQTPSVPVTYGVGKLWWDATGTLNIGMGNGNITQQVGEEFYRYGKASEAISDVNLQLVYKTGVVGASGKITFAPTIAGITEADLILGVATEPIPKNSFGRITVSGVVNNINTTGSIYGEVWADNDDIWYNPVTGGLTKTKPTAPNIKLQIGTVINAGAGNSGSFIVKLGSSSTLGGTDSNVQFSSLVDKDIIQYDASTSVWRNYPIGSSSGMQPYSASLTAIAGLSFADNNFIVGNGTTWVAESGSTARTSLGLGSIATQDANNVVITGGSINATTVGATTPASGSFTSITDSGNITFTGTGNLITGDFSNATITNRVMFQTSTTNGRTNISVLPNGTSTTACIDLYSSSSDPANSSQFRIANSGAEFQLEGSRTGTGTYLPMTFYTGGSKRVTIDTSGNVGVNNIPSGTYRFEVTGDGYFSTGITLGSALAVGSGGTGQSTYTDGQLLIGNSTGNTLTKATLTQGTGITITNGSGAISIANAGVTSISGGTTGLTPNTATTGNVTLAGILGVANGGTGQSTYTDGQLLIGNSTGNTLSKATLTQGTGITITNGSGAITVTNASPMVYPGAGIPNSTGSAWGTSLTAPTGALVGTSDSQTLTNKTLTNPTINGFTGDTSVINIGTGQVYKDTSGNVGLGTTSPKSLGAGRTSLTLNGSTDSLIWFQSNGTDIGYVQGTSTQFTLVGNGKNLVLSATSTADVRLAAAGGTGLIVNADKNVIINTAAVATTATAGFLWIPSCAGAPTGAPTAPYTNAAALVADTTNNRLYVRIGTTWKYASLV